MALTEGKKAVRLPRGAAIWPRLNTPDTKYNAAGVYETKIAFEADTPDLDKIMATVDAMIEAEFEAQKQKLIDDGKPKLAEKIVKADSPFKEEEDDEGELTGRIVVKAKMTASGVSKKTGKPWKLKPDIFNAKGVKLQNPPEIGGGSTLVLNVDLAPYFAANDKSCGVSVRLNAAQVIKLVTFGQRDAGAYGFGAEEDGDDIDDGVPQDDSASSGGDEEDDDL